jgi:hypothetical protein
MKIPRMLNVKTKPTKDPKFAGIKETISWFIERIPAASVIGDI